MGEQREFRDTALAPRQYPAIVQMDRVVGESMRRDGADATPLSFEQFAQHAFDYVADSLDQANERIEQLVAERDWALGQLREVEHDTLLARAQFERASPSLRPWRSLLMRSPVEPVSRTRWGIAFLLLLALPILCIAIVEPSLRPHVRVSPLHAALLEPAVIVCLLILLLGTWAIRPRR